MNKNLESLCRSHSVKKTISFPYAATMAFASMVMDVMLAKNIEISRSLQTNGLASLPRPDPEHCPDVPYVKCMEDVTETHLYLYDDRQDHVKVEPESLVTIQLKAMYNGNVLLTYIYSNGMGATQREQVVSPKYFYEAAKTDVLNFFNKYQLPEENRV